LEIIYFFSIILIILKFKHMKQINKITGKIILAALVSFCLLSPKTGDAQSAKWTDIFTASNANFYDIQKNFEKQEKKWERADRRALKKGEEVREHAGEEVYKRWESYMAPRVYPTGNLTLPSNTYANFIQWKRDYPGIQTQKKTRAGNWTELGPIGSPSGPLPYTRTGAGRVNFVRFDPNNSNILYVGAPDGGLWKSTNGGTSWTTNTDFLTVIGCSDLCIDPTNTQIMYLATGDLENNRRSAGVLKSTDGGATWNATGLSWTAVDNYLISKMVMNPSNPLNMIITTTDGGTFRTTDGWATSTGGVFPSGFPYLMDMELKPGDPNTVYAAGNKFFKSTDNGVNWSEITTGLPVAGVQRIALGVTPGNNAYVYALFAKASDQSYLGMYRSTNSGTSFSLRSSTPNLLGYNTDGLDNGGQGFYDLAVTVSPTNADIVTTGGVNHWQSIDGGTTWSNLSFWASGEVHADVHEVSYLPGSSSTMFSCNDGGIFKSTDNGNTFVDISNNLAIAQCVGIGQSSNVSTTIVNGSQDNGSNLKTGASWANIYGGDGGECFIDPTNNNTIYGQYVQGSFFRSDDGGLSNNAITTGLPTPLNQNFDFYSTWIMDPVNSNRLYVGGIPTLYTSANQGNLWTALGTPSGSGSIKGIAVAPSNTTIIYAIKDDAISRSINSGTSFTNITGTLPVGSAALSSVTVCNTDANKVWVTFSGYSAGDKVFKSVDGGANWTNISAGLPNLPINEVVYTNGNANDAIYIGADIGVYYMDNITPWVSYFTDLPNVAVRDLEIYYPDSKIRAGTYGRGVWESPLFVNAPLPVTIESFTGETQNETNRLHWTVAQETNLLNYELQRSGDAINFNTIATIKANASSNEASYKYTDTKPFSGNNYYRLQANDIDAKASYSNIVNLFITKAGANIYPNPATDMVTVEMQNVQFTIQLIDENGKLLYKNAHADNKVQIDTHQFATGLYTLEITTMDGTTQTQKISITR
jgi:hypothetical protein